ncbi:hypothetical protein DFA_10490 [Cavenderia fasciculata]|uniref:Uncharacterized protein n=1 Tax=Cavenderia fasciculata TaxID=261658 RepID=F4QAC9_CACFS|nr:uncharacterized protein DFA_10490 [Cavenderia fasciculata]EGG15648.1 hypothetical protein DFA_10490 [Cavenderia fasciculata]|eukprot:XP_004354390.1 hypothetical protein DFA_10490 [Cavenderia fasciculata]
MTTQELNDLSFIPPGIYKAIVNGNHKCFKINERNHYTHYDLGFAKQLGLEFNLIQENQPNALLKENTRFGRQTEHEMKEKNLLELERTIQANQVNQAKQTEQQQPIMVDQILPNDLIEMVPRNNLTATNDFVKEYSL